MADASSTRSGQRRRAVITGASSGIGAAFAQQLAHDQYDLIIVARRRDRLDELAQQLRAAHAVSVEPLAADLGDRTELGVLEDVVAGDDHLDLLVNNAGFGTAGRFVELDPDGEEAEVRLNIIALTRLTRAALPGMLARGSGAIINVSSLAAFQPAPFTSTYAATKAYISSFTESVQEELRGSGVRLQILCPGFTRTEFQQHAGLDVSAVPGFAWMSADAVVQASLASLRRGDLFCIPGIQNKVVATLSTSVPRGLRRRIIGVLTRNMTGLH